MQYTEAHEKFRAAEDSFDIFKKREGNFAYWDYMRFQAFQALLAKLGIVEVIKSKKAKSSLLTKYKHKFQNWRTSHKYSLHNKHKKNYLFISNGAVRRKKSDDGYHWDIWCDPVIEHLGADNCVLLEKPHLGTHSNHKTKNLISTSFVERFKKPKSVTKNLKISPETIATLNAMEESLKRSFPQLTANIGLITLLKKHLHTRLRMLSAYQNFFKKLSPKAIFIICSYSGRELYVEAAKSLNIPIIELQHGVVYPCHVGYSHPSPCSKKYTVDHFLSYGSYWTDSLNLPLKKTNIKAMGYPYMDKTLNRPKITKKKQIVVISQPIIGKKLQKFSTKLADLLPPDWTLIYKLHPRETTCWEEKYTALANSNIKVIDGQTPSLEDLFAESSIQIGVNSTAVYEGLAHGCKTYLVNLASVEILEKLFSMEQVQLVNSPEEIDFISSDHSDISTELFFAKNWQKNLDQALKDWKITS